MRQRPEPVDVSQIRFWVPVEVRYSDLDAQGHVNNATYFTYFEQARVQYFHTLRFHRALAVAQPDQPKQSGQSEQADAAGLPPDPHAADLPFVIVNADCFYRRPVTAIAHVSVGVHATRVTHTSIELQYAVCAAPGGAVHAIGSTLIASVDPTTGRPRALPEWARHAIDTMEREGPPAGPANGTS
jgi:acyl-CoA thioester hydrolase